MYGSPIVILGQISFFRNFDFVSFSHVFDIFSTCHVLLNKETKYLAPIYVSVLRISVVICSFSGAKLFLVWWMASWVYWIVSPFAKCSWYLCHLLVDIVSCGSSLFRITAATETQAAVEIIVNYKLSEKVSAFTCIIRLLQLIFCAWYFS